ncbi:MAG TPA: protein kinase, partial [Ktedonobacteraceae bacterium]|nr:protein kinase [Ktedonobacteraceae bacterium]
MSTTSPLIGQTLGDCVLLAELSGHAWSRCYLGERVQPDDQRTLVLLEHLPFLQVATPLAWQAFCQRVEAFQHLTHPALVQVIGCGLDPEQQPYLLGPYESLRSLETLVRRRLPRPFSLTQALNMVLQLGQVVHYLHQQGWWLGNIRPETIYLTAQGDLRLRLSSLEPLYASIKQEKINIPARQQQDQWALAALAYTLCTGKSLPSEAADGQTGKADRRSDVFVPREVISTLPREVGRALLKALDPDPLRRYGSVLAFVLALNGRMTQQEGEERPRVRRLFGQHAGKMKSSAMSLESRPQARTAELVQERADSLLEKADMFSSTGAFASSSETRATLAEKEHLLPERDITPPALPWSAVLSSPVGATTAAFATVQHTAAHNQITSPITSSVSLGAPLGKRLQRSRRRVWKRLLLASSMLIFVAASAGGLWLALRNQGNGHIVGNTGKTLAQRATATAAVSSSVPQLKVSFPCASPTACGFPDARSTGAPAEMHLTAQSGDIKVQQDGQ